MRAENAVYGGEMSAHHYFREFNYCDSGMIPWLLVIELLSLTKKSLSELISERIEMYPASGEINLKIDSPNNAINSIFQVYKTKAKHFDDTDGISLEFDDKQGQWRFNLRSSNTEPVVRLNVESKRDRTLMQEKTQELLVLLRQF